MAWKYSETWPVCLLKVVAGLEVDSGLGIFVCAVVDFESVAFVLVKSDRVDVDVAQSLVLH